MIEHLAGVRVLGLEHLLRRVLQQRHVARGTDLQELVGDRGALAENAAHLLRVLVADEPRLGQRIHGDDAPAVALALLERRQHARMVRARVLPENDHQVGLAEVVVGDRRLADADRLAHRGAGRLVAHVGAVGEVVGAEGAHEELVEERRLVGGAAARIERGLVGVPEGVEPVADEGEGALPRDRLVVVGVGPLVDRLGEPPLLAEPVLVLVEQRRERVLGPEAGRHRDRRRLPRDGLHAVLAELERVAVTRVGPRAAHAVEAVLLVDREGELRGARDAHLEQRGLHRVEDGGHAHRPRLVVADLDVGIRVGERGGLGDLGAAAHRLPGRGRGHA